LIRHFDRILDIGCGTGNITDEIACEIITQSGYCVDISESMVEFAKNNYKRDLLSISLQIYVKIGLI